MRATTRGTPYSVFANSEATRFTLSSPVAATSTWQLFKTALSSDVISQASAINHSASGTDSIFNALGSRSIKSTWWPLSRSSRAIARPTFPAPAIAILMSGPPVSEPKSPQLQRYLQRERLRASNRLLVRRCAHLELILLPGELEMQRVHQLLIQFQ